jgi:CHAT domain-containing protein
VRDPAVWKGRSGTLFRQLIAPVLTHLPAGTARLVVVPDADLYGLPFRALWDDSSGRYLDEELVLSLAPSVRLALDPPGPRPPPAPPRPFAALSLGFGEFAPQLGLRSLPRAAAEATAVRAVYPGDRPACSANDWDNFRQCAPSCDVIHLATHAAAGPTPSTSWLAWPRETVDLNQLWRELPDLPARPLVVLSSCESAAVAAGGEGLGGLARPFLASGARAVVGTLWKIDDEDAADLFLALHRAYARRPGDAAQALRAARELTRDWQQRPWVWGGVEVVSGQPAR